MQRVSSGLGHGIDHAPGGLPQLRAVIAGRYLELLQRIHAVDIAERSAALGLGEESLAVAGAVYRALVVQAGDAAVGYQSRAVIGGGGARQQREAFPAP